MANCRMNSNFRLEQHLGICEDCRREWNALLALNEELALDSNDGAVTQPAGRVTHAVG